MKELRFDEPDGVWRVAFATHPNRKTVVLVCGDESGGEQKALLRQLIEKADARFDTHLAGIRKEKQKGESRT